MTSETAALDDVHRTAFEVAQAIAPGWERRRPFVERTVGAVREWLIRELDPQPGTTVLELAAGAGDTGYEVAKRLGGKGRLISSDFSPAMVEVGRRRSSELGVPNVEHRVIDAERIDLDDASVDAVLCRFGFMLMVDRAAALAETRRVVRPGGRVALAVWGPPDRNPFFSALGKAMVQAGHMPPPDPTAPGPFSMGDPEHTRGLLEAAGLEVARLEEVPARFEFADVGEYLDIARDTAGPLAMALRSLSEGDLEAITKQLEEALEPFAADGRYQVPGVALCALARRPGT
jgi:ubiquinone/menaquinone biosynthesis C-methylase UbiE